MNKRVYFLGLGLIPPLLPSPPPSLSLSFPKQTPDLDAYLEGPLTKEHLLYLKKYEAPKKKKMLRNPPTPPLLGESHLLLSPYHF